MVSGLINGIPIITDGWLSSAKKIPSRNFNARPDNEISLLVIHNISLPPKKFGGEYVEKFFTGQLPVEDDPYFETIKDLEVSSHLYIKRTGEVVQFVSFLERAWHAGKSCFNGRNACNDFAVGIELEGADDIPYTDEQYLSLEQVTKVLMNSYPKITVDRIVGHEHVAPDRKTDPGQAFDWKRFIDSLTR